MLKKYLAPSVIVLFLILGFLLYVLSSDVSPQNKTEQKTTRTVPEGYNEYTSPVLRISLLYPDFLEIRLHRETATSFSILFEDPEGKAGFQVYVRNYGGPTISDEEFRIDVPSGVRENEKNIYVDGVSALQFDSIDADIGETREVWFINHGYLYEVTTYRPLGRWLQEEVLRNWRFL